MLRRIINRSQRPLRVVINRNASTQTTKNNKQTKVDWTREYERPSDDEVELNPPNANELEGIANWETAQNEWKTSSTTSARTNK
jgi:hypothetical protein